MRRVFMCAAALISIFYASAQTNTDTWAKWKNLIGEWVGDGSEQKGEASGWFSFKTDLDNKILVRKNHSQYLPPPGDMWGFVHDDLLIIYPGENGNPDRAIYFDNEGHVIDYSITFSDDNKNIVFISEASDKGPRFRLSYTLVNADLVKIKFEFASPGKPDVFTPYIEASASRKK